MSRRHFVRPQQALPCNGASILLLLREKQASNFQDLCKAFDIPEILKPRQRIMSWRKRVRLLEQRNIALAMTVDLIEKLEKLREAELIEYEPGANSRELISEKNISIHVTKNLEKTQVALGALLSDIAQLDSRSLVVQPSFETPQAQKNATDIFVLMSFDPELEKIYESHIAKVASDANLSISRADDFFSTGSVISDIWAGILGAKAIIADCSDRNPNVFYELGIAHTLGKSVTLITQRADDIPFDTQHLRHIHYESTPKGLKKLEGELRTTLLRSLEIQHAQRHRRPLF